MKQTFHYTAPYILNPTHPVTVNLIGVGGTGSHVLTNLARLHYTLQQKEHPGLHVRVFDPDTVSETNPGRQLYSEADIGFQKATLSVTRINRTMGTNWQAFPELFTNQVDANITITCVDNKKSRIEIGKHLLGKKDYYQYSEYQNPYYWLDFGNTRTSGQAILGTTHKIQQVESKEFCTVGKLLCVTEKFDLEQVEEKDSGPSCSTAAALQEQDLFINSALAQIGCNLLWNLFNNWGVFHSTVYLNLEDYSMNGERVESLPKKENLNSKKNATRTKKRTLPAAAE